jgi:hypothetical protein
MAKMDMDDPFSGKSKITSRTSGETADWMGDVQRSRLKGFARLRAIFWRRSVRLYEAWALRSRPWVRPLRRELRREFSTVDTDDASRLTERADIFGETPILTVIKLLELAGSFGSLPDAFLDLGSGRGTTCFTAANCGFRATGIEKESDWVQRAERIARRLELEATFHCADFTDFDWPKRAVVFVVATAFGPDLRQTVLERMKELQSGSIVLTGDWTGLDGLELLWQGPLPVDWGVIPFSVYRVGG